MRGEDKAPDSGLDHWDHIGANAMIVKKAKLAGTLVDDRGPHQPGVEGVARKADPQRYLAPTRASVDFDDLDRDVHGGDPHESNWKAMD
jgi:hypothetical protein